MMKTEIFEFQNYKAYLDYAIEQKARKGRGVRSALASFIGCQTPYVSQVLNAGMHFSLEQGMKINQFFGHSSEESHYFLLLLQFERAGTDDLRSYFGKQMQEVAERRKILKERIPIDNPLTTEGRTLYYSSWHYAAIHVILSIPGLRTKSGIAQHLGISLSKVTEILEFLESVGLVKKLKNEYEISAQRIHLGADSPHFSKHHTNWRLRAIDSLNSINQAERGTSQNLYYSSAITVSKKDSQVIRSMLVKQIEEIKEIVRNSPEEEPFAFCLDFFGF